MFFLEGGDGVEAQEYARLKGEHEAIETASIQKKCGNGAIVDTSLDLDISDRLEKLNDLKTKGLISEEEYVQQRNTILKSM